MQHDVLVIEDDEGINLLLSTFLARHGFRVHTARNGREGIELLKLRRYAVVLLDLMMPVMNGFEVIDYMEQATPGEVTRSVIVWTAAADRDVEQLQAKPVFRLIRKPFQLAHLRAAIHDCINSPSPAGASSN